MTISLFLRAKHPIRIANIIDIPKKILSSIRSNVRWWERGTRIMALTNDKNKKADTK